MSKHNLYSVYDSAVAAYMKPLVFSADGEATRWFSDQATNAESMVNRHPEDYSIFRVGMFDDQKGELTYEEPTCLARAHELIALSRKVDKKQMELMDVSAGGTN